MIKNKDTIIPVTEVECIVKKCCNDQNKRKITSNKWRKSRIHNYENQSFIEMDEVNTKINKCDMQLPLQQYHQNKPSFSVKGYKYRHHANDRLYINKNNICDNHLQSEQSSPKCDISEKEDNIKSNTYNLENTSNDNSEHEAKIITVGTQTNKTAITLLNEWAMRGEEKKPFTVSYVLVAITGHAHKPLFTYMCQTHNMKALGEGKSKKEAKQNAAAQMCKKLFNLRIDSVNDSDKFISSTTTTDNSEVSENDTFLRSTEGSLTIDETNSDVDDEGLQQFKYEAVQIAHCDMNPIGALQELCTTYKWTPPIYSFEILKKDQSECKIVLYKVTCEVFHLQTMGIDSFKKGAKRKAAHLMFEKIFDVGTEQLNELKSSYPITLLSTEDCEQNKFISIIHDEENQKLSNKWVSAYCFRSYFTETTASRTAMNDLTTISLVEDNPTQGDQQLGRSTTELEQFIIEHYDPNASAVNKLEILCKELGFQAIYVCLGIQKIKDFENNTGQDEEYGVLVQVTSVPITVTTGYGTTTDVAAEEAAKSILQTFKAMLLFTKPATVNFNNNNEEEKIINVM